jgi:hypothetical protein
MFTDLVGYSSITSLDEGRALKLLEDHRSLFQSIFGKYLKDMMIGLLN